MKMRTGLTLAEFETLLLSLPSLMDKFRSRERASDALFTYLMKIHTGYSHEAIGYYIGISKSLVGSRLKVVRKILMEDFVPNYVNYTRSRQDLLSHTSRLSKSLLSPRNEEAVILIWDGTYIYIEKSQQHAFQKSSYCSHKKRNYVKPMMIVATDGTIIAVIGPFKATENDAKISTKILSQGHPVLDNMETSDVVVLDRGFRDCIREFQSRGYIVKTPACQPPGKQLTTVEANQSRLVTKIRYDVERINGMVKATFQIFSKVWESLLVPYLMMDLQIAAALLNKFFIKPNENEQLSIELGRRMLARVNKENLLSKVVNKLAKVAREEFSTHEIFPELTMNDLKSIAFGEYQITQSKLYANDHSKTNDGVFKVFKFNDEIVDKYFENYKDKNPTLVMLNISSRFISGKSWQPFVLFSKIQSGVEAVLEYCCNCKVGLRTVGCCSHVMTILYYLGFAQYRNGVEEKATHLQNFFI